MNMVKLGRRLFAWCLLTILFPLAANAVPKVEMTAYITEVVTDEADLPIEIKVAVVEGEPWEVHIDELTEVNVVLAAYATVTIEALFAQKEGKIIALEIRASEDAPYEFEGTITEVDKDRNITLIGHKIHVPVGAEIKNASGQTIGIDELKGYVTVEGDILTSGNGAYFDVSEIRILNTSFSCLGKSDHIFTAGKPADDMSKSTDHYCNLRKGGKRVGSTEISHTDYTWTD